MGSRSKSRASKHKHESDSGNTSEPKTKSTKKNKDEPKVDRFCWLCHTKGNDQSCVACRRSYHNICLEEASASFTELEVCPECQIKSVDGTELRSNRYLSFDKLKKILDILTRRSFERSRKRNTLFLSWPEDRRANLFKIIDFEILLDNVIHVLPYTKTAEFYGDVKYICHNSYIAFGANSEQFKAAENLKRDFKAELLELEACPECYYHMYCCENDCVDPFVRLCESPHDIVWAQVTGHSSWPAKCLKVIKGIAHVRFFGKHEVSKIPIKKCYYLSQSHPKVDPKSPQYKSAKEELLKYINMYRLKYGEFPFYPHKTPYKPHAMQNQVFIHSTVGNCNRNTIEMKLEGNVNEEEEMFVVNSTIVVEPEDTLTSENSLSDNTPTSNATNILASEIEGQYPISDQITSSSDASSSPCQGDLNKNPPAVTSIDMTFSAESNFNTDHATSVVASISSLPPTDTVSNSNENTINIDGKKLEKFQDVYYHDSRETETVQTIDTYSVIDNVSNNSSLQPYSSSNFVNNFPIYTRSPTDFDDDVIVIEEHRDNIGLGSFNPHAVLPVLLGENPEMRDLIQKSRYLSDALIIQLYASFGRNHNNVGKLSKLCVDLRKSKTEHKQALEEIGKLRKENETNNNTIQVLIDNANKLEVKVKELQAKLELAENTHSEAKRNAQLIIRGLQTSCVRKIEKRLKAEHFSELSESQKYIMESLRSMKEIVEVAREANELRKKEYEELKVKYERAENKIKALESQFSPDVISNYKRMHFCSVCERSAGEVCCLNTSYCSRDCKERDAEKHKKYCRNDKITSQIVQQRVISQQSVVMVSHGVVHSGRSGVNNPSSPQEVSDTEKTTSSPYHTNSQMHQPTSPALLPTPHYRSSSSRNYTSKGKRRPCI